MSVSVKLCLLFTEEASLAVSASPGPSKSVATVPARPTLPARSAVHVCV